MRIIKLCSILFGIVIDACCDKQDSLMCGGLCNKCLSILSAINYFTDAIIDHTPPVIDLKPILSRIMFYADLTCILSPH